MPPGIVIEEDESRPGRLPAQTVLGISEVWQPSGPRERLYRLKRLPSGIVLWQGDEEAARRLLEGLASLLGVQVSWERAGRRKKG